MKPFTVWSDQSSLSCWWRGSSGFSNTCKVGSSYLRTNRLLSRDVKSPCSYFILEIKQGFMREFGSRCQRGPLQSCFKNGTMKTNPIEIYRGGVRRGGVSKYYTLIYLPLLDVQRWIYTLYMTSKLHHENLWLVLNKLLLDFSTGHFPPKWRK